MATSRYLSSFQSLDGVYSFTLPQYAYEYQPRQNLRESEVIVMGRDFALDLMSGKVLLKEVAEESASLVSLNESLTALDTAIDNMKSALYHGADGYLFTTGADGTVRRARGRLTRMPEMTLSTIPYAIPTAIHFKRYSLWGVASAINTSTLVTANGQTWTVNNPGNTPITKMVIRLRANTSAGIVNPIITNNSAPVASPAVFASLRDSVSVNSEIKLDTSVPSVEWSDNNGSSYVDDFANYVLPTGVQALLSFRLIPGNNTIQYNGSGTPNLQVEFVADSGFL
jgi:hypothetical protein